MAVRDELAGLVPAHGEPAPVHHVVQPQLEELEQARAGDPLGAGGFLVVAAELLFQDAVDAARLLLLAELDQVLALLDATPAMLAGRVGAALDGALGPHAAGPLQEELHAFPAAEPADRPGVACHFKLRPSVGLRASNPPPLAGAAPVVRNRRRIHDAEDLEARSLERPDGGLPPGPRALHEHVDLADAVLLSAPAGGLGGELGSKRGRLPGSLEADVAGGRPRQCVARPVGDGDDRVVERRLDMGLAVDDVLLLFALGLLCFWHSASTSPSSA